MLAILAVVVLVQVVAAWRMPVTVTRARVFRQAVDVQPCRSGMSQFMMPRSHFHASKLHRLQPMLASSTVNFAEVVEDMIYSGDADGILRRGSKDLINEEFVEFLVEKIDSLSSPDEADERSVVQAVLNDVRLRLRQTDGMGEDSGLVYERRLDKILFTSPRERRNYITEKADEMTMGFVEYVQKELQAMTDDDSKVVLASILQMIGQSKSSDFLGTNAELLSRADETLGDEFKKVKPDFQGASLIGNRNEQILAGLLFSKNDPVEDILNNLMHIDDDFVLFLQTKIDSTINDLEERAGLSSLLDTITDVKARIEQAESSMEGDADMDIGNEELNMEQVAARMKAVQAGREVTSTPKAPTVDEFSVKEDKKQTFETILAHFTTKPEGVTLQEVAKKHYDLCDYEFQQMLQAEAKECLAVGADLEAQIYTDILAAVNAEMAVRIGSAQERLMKILSKGDPMAMEAEAVAMARRNEADEALVLLIEVNAQQAREAGATDAATLLEKIKRRIYDEKERKLPDEQRLLRKLLRLDNSEDRKGLLFAAFKPQKSANSEGEISELPPLVTPPAFINMVRGFIQNFGNVDGYNMMGRAQAIVDEAQVVATELYGEGMSPRDQQRLMFEKNTLSVWDLANYEEQAMMSGEEIPWENNAFDGKEPEEVLGERVQRVGGVDGL